VESALGGRLGCTLSLNNLPAQKGHALTNLELLFSETPSRFLVSVKPEDVAGFQFLLSGFSCAALGKVETKDAICIKRKGKEILKIKLSEALKAWKGSL
jgi:phosphoribosylformylglycinamidine (FGAM) synthase-like enzyme